MPRLEDAAEKYHDAKSVFDAADAELRAAVREARAGGASLAQVATRIRMSRETVRRYGKADSI